MYTELISLGYNCGAAYQIRLHKRVNEAHVFDWLYTSIEAATGLIAGNFEGFMHRDRLEITRNGAELFDHNSGIRFNHSFKVGGKVLPELIERDFDTERAKFDFLVDRFRNKVVAAEGRSAFIRYNPYLGKADDRRKIDALVAALDARMANPDFMLYWVVASEVGGPMEQIGERITLCPIAENPSRSTSFHGSSFTHTDDIAWGALLAQIPLDTTGKKMLESDAPVLSKKAGYD